MSTRTSESQAQYQLELGPYVYIETPPAIGHPHVQKQNRATRNRPRGPRPMLMDTLRAPIDEQSVRYVDLKNNERLSKPETNPSHTSQTIDYLKDDLRGPRHKHAFRAPLDDRIVNKQEKRHIPHFTQPVSRVTLNPSNSLSRYPCINGFMSSHSSPNAPIEEIPPAYAKLPAMTFDDGSMISQAELDQIMVKIEMQLDAESFLPPKLPVLECDKQYLNLKVEMLPPPQLPPLVFDQEEFVAKGDIDRIMEGSTKKPLATISTDITIHVP